MNIVRISTTPKNDDVQKTIDVDQNNACFRIPERGFSNIDSPLAFNV